MTCAIYHVYDISYMGRAPSQNDLLRQPEGRIDKAMGGQDRELVDDGAEDDRNRFKRAVGGVTVLEMARPSLIAW